MRRSTRARSGLGWAVLLAVVGGGAVSASGKTVTHYVYDEDDQNHGQPTSVWVEGSSSDRGDALADTTYAYDRLGRRWKVTRRGDANTNGAGDHVTLTTYDYSGNVSQSIEKGPGNSGDDIDSGDAVTWNEYDHVGRLTLTKLTDGDPGTTLFQTEYEYDDSGNVTRTRVLVDDEGGNTYLDTITAYDALNRATRVTDPQGHYQVSEYDSQNRLIVQTSYDADSNGLAKQAWYYDNAGRLAKTVRFAAVATGYDAADPATDAVVECEYDADGRMLTQTRYLVESGQASGLDTVNEYDDIGRLTLSTDPAGNERETSYEDETGLVFKREERDGAGAHNLVYWYEYDGMGRLTHETVSGESDLETWYEYDGWLLTGRYVKTTDLTERWIEHHIV